MGKSGCTSGSPLFLNYCGQEKKGIACSLFTRFYKITPEGIIFEADCSHICTGYWTRVPERLGKVMWCHGSFKSCKDVATFMSQDAIAARLYYVFRWYYVFRLYYVFRTMLRLLSRFGAFSVFGTRFGKRGILIRWIDRKINQWVDHKPFHSQEWSISNFPCSLTRNITSHRMKNFAFHSLLRW